MASNTAKRMIDLNVIDETYRPRSRKRLFSIVMFFTFAIVFGAISLVSANDGDMPQIGKVLFIPVSPLMALLGLHSLRSYRREYFQIQGGQLIHARASGETRRMSLTDVLEVNKYTGEDGGWSCNVITRAESFWFSEDLINCEEFYDFLDYAAKHNPTNIQIDFPRKI